MLLIKTYLKKSNISNAGIGCFADEFIPKDTLIWKFNPNIDRKFTQEEFDKFNNLEKEFLKIYCYKNNEEYYLCVDNGRFFNHSENSNTYEGLDQSTYALKDIHKDEEIVSNYIDFGITPNDTLFNTML